MEVFIVFPVIQILHELGRSIAEMERNRQITVFFDILSRSDSGAIGDIILFGFGQIDGQLKQEDIAFRHSDLGDSIVDLIGEQQSVVVSRSDIFGCETQKPSRKIQGILASHKHPLHPITCSVSVAVTQRFMDGRDDIVMFLSVPIVIYVLLSRLEDELIGDHSVFGKEYG